MLAATFFTIITAILMGYYGYKTTTSRGNKIGGLPMLVMKATPFIFVITFIVGFMKIGWKTVFILPVLYIIGIPAKNLFLYIGRKNRAFNER